MSRVAAAILLLTVALIGGTAPAGTARSMSATSASTPSPRPASSTASVARSHVSGVTPGHAASRTATAVLPRVAWVAERRPDTDAGTDAATDAAARPDPAARVRGMTVSCPGSGRIWGTDAMVETMADLRDLGVNWIAIHPYAGIAADGTVSFRGRRGMYDDPVWLRRPIEEAHRLGLKIMIKPHLAYWGSPFSWRGEITFETDEQWARFFDTYTEWITHVAELSRDADAFVVGTELDRTVHHDARWREIIADVRARTAAPLTYAANWDSYERVGFWDALDVIGIQAYFPLVRHDRMPTDGELRAGWERLFDALDDYARARNRRIVFAELGYNRAASAARTPWDHRTGGPDAEETQRRCMSVALDVLREHETVVGAFLWKWFPGNPRRGNFLMTTPAMRAVIAEAWRGPAPDDASPPPGPRTPSAPATDAAPARTPPAGDGSDAEPKPPAATGPLRR